jgi:uncharacterized protein with LGFP repeats
LLGRLGSKVGTEVTGLTNGGSMQMYEHGSIYYTAATGAHVIEGSIGAKWIAAGAQKGFLGYPTSDTQTGLTNGGSTQRFVAGTIASSPTTGVRIARGGIGNRWMAAGSQNGLLGYPITDEIPVANGGEFRRGDVYQKYQGGSIYWDPVRQARIMHGAIGALWASLGAERSKLGYPAGEEVGAQPRGGVYQQFVSGSKVSEIYWTPVSGAHYVLGAIRSAWGIPYVFDKIGYPITNEIAGLKNGGVYQRYQFKNGAIYYSPASGAWPVLGAIRSAWAATGAERGRLGYPTSVEFLSFGETVQNYQNGSISYTPARGTTVNIWR